MENVPKKKMDLSFCSLWVPLLRRNNRAEHGERKRVCALHSLMAIGGFFFLLRRNVRNFTPNRLVIHPAKFNFSLAPSWNIIDVLY